MIHITKRHLDIGLHKVKISDVVVDEKDNSILITFTNDDGYFVYNISYNYLLNTNFFESYMLNDSLNIVFRNNALTNKKNKPLRSLVYENFMDTRVNIFHRAITPGDTNRFNQVTQYYEYFEHSFWNDRDQNNAWDTQSIADAFIGKELYIIVDRNPLTIMQPPLFTGLTFFYTEKYNVEINIERLYKIFNPAQVDYYEMSEENKEIYIEYYTKNEIHNLYSQKVLKEARSIKVDYINPNVSSRETSTSTDIQDRNIALNPNEWNSYKLQILAFIKPEEIEIN